MVSPPTRIIHTYTAHRTHTHTAHTHTPHTHTHTQTHTHTHTVSHALPFLQRSTGGCHFHRRQSGCMGETTRERLRFVATRWGRSTRTKTPFFSCTETLQSSRMPARIFYLARQSPFGPMSPSRQAQGGQEGRRAGGQEGKRRGWSENVCACACSCMCVKSIPGKHAMANGLYMCACGRQGERDPWHLVFRGELPDEFFAGDDGNTHQECLMPRGGMLHSMQQVTPHTHTYTHIHTHTYTHTHTQHTLSCCKGKGHVKIKHASQKLKDFEQDLFHYLQELRDLPFYPGYRRCNADNMFFCKHP